VNPYAEPPTFSSGNIRKYATTIKINKPPEGLRSGMNAEARIHVERKSEALQVPVQALAEHKGHYFSLVQSADGEYKTREVFINSTNDKVATIEKGLNNGDIVVMNPRGAGSLLVLPDLPDPTPTSLAEVTRTEGTPVSLTSPAGGPPPGGPPGESGPGGGKRGKGSMTPAMRVAQYLESDADGDGKLSKEEVSKMDDRRRQALATADKDGDGFLTNTELTTAAVGAAAAFQQKMRERGGEGGGEGGGRGGRSGRGGEGGPFPAGGGE
jgi:hypothetical protein